MADDLRVGQVIVNSEVHWEQTVGILVSFDSQCQKHTTPVRLYYAGVPKLEQIFMLENSHLMSETIKAARVKGQTF